ncbi:uncharacterized protein A1O5_02810 [Cladophialophora psammophila CBS 110553]|uniref:Uncharacterized protein n=1 Tax=Cladophialophora psammophila CBS 110553 TaxID=1182543 RepID=W9XW86_9EURO|nr:uncharacterized protein A1O5_02810 [Cladophialophora psammophila CBS 110553]EXJ74514.1 hypothetical protein A1O5_02810 [Cladophialophora psammophila CBS 110553]
MLYRSNLKHQVPNDTAIDTRIRTLVATKRKTIRTQPLTNNVEEVENIHLDRFIQTQPRPETGGGITGVVVLMNQARLAENLAPVPVAQNSSV